MTNKFDNNEVFQTVVMLSVCINTIFFFIMWQIKELQVHPMKLFMLITACDATVLYIYSMSRRTCNLDFQKLLMWTTHFDNSCASEESALNALLNSIAFMATFASVFGLWCQAFIAIDLILTIHRPFTPRESRMPIYIGISIACALF